MSADHFSIAIHVPFNQNWKYGEKYSLTKSILVEFCCQCLKEKKLGASWFFFHLVFVVCAWLLSPSVTDCCCLWPTNNMDQLILPTFVTFVTYDLKSHLRATNKLCGSVDLVRPLFFSPLRSICARPHFPNHFTHFNKQPQNWPRQENHFLKQWHTKIYDSPKNCFFCELPFFWQHSLHLSEIKILS